MSRLGHVLVVEMAVELADYGETDFKRRVVRGDFRQSLRSAESNPSPEPKVGIGVRVADPML